MQAKEASFVIEMQGTYADIPRSEPVLWLSVAIFYGVIAVLIFACVAFGAIETCPQFIHRIAALGLSGLWMTKEFSEEPEPGDDWLGQSAESKIRMPLGTKFKTRAQGGVAVRS
jgi:hypothetical protein